MFQSTLLKRTMTLVVVSLIASALLATIAFLVAGRIATMTLEIDSCLEQDLRYHEIFTNNPEYFEDVDFRLFFFNSTYATGHDYYLVNMKFVEIASSNASWEIKFVLFVEVKFEELKKMKILKFK